jgi:hypothetical protein
MAIRRFIGMVLAAGLGAAAAPAQAHHSGAMFDSAKTVTVMGTLKGVEWTNPHSWLSVVGTPDGKGPGTQWDLESVSPGTLVRMGLGKDQLQVGAKVSVDFHPLRDGRRGGSLVAVTFADGRTVRASGAAPAGPANTPPVEGR